MVMIGVNSNKKKNSVSGESVVSRSGAVMDADSDDTGIML